MSEFLGCAETIKGAVVVNPYDIEDISHKLAESISMNSLQKIQRMEQTYDYITSHSTLKWAHNFLTNVKCCKGST